jgi:hypothetical protein
MMVRRLVRLIADDDLENGVVVGSGCCSAVAPDDLAREELNSWPGVEVRSLDLETGIITISLDGNAPPVEDLVDALQDQGIAVHVDQQRPA